MNDESERKEPEKETSETTPVASTLTTIQESRREGDKTGEDLSAAPGKHHQGTIGKGGDAGNQRRESYT